MFKSLRRKPIFMLVGNQCDKSYEREVSHQEGIALARMFGCEFMETSARTAYNAEPPFTNVDTTAVYFQRTAGRQKTHQMCNHVMDVFSSGDW